LYGILLCAVTALTTGIYRTICKTKYQECKFRFFWNKEIFKEIAGFAGWNLIGASAGIFKNQAVNILLNQFFNSMIVTSRSITVSVNNALSVFFNNFAIAINPQIIKSYASGKKKEVTSLVFSSSKFIYYMTYIVVLPSILEMPKILSLWLKTFPENLVLFNRLALLDTLICSIGIPLGIAASAAGKIKAYQAGLGIIHILNFPFCFAVLLLGFPAYSVMIVGVFLSFAAFVARLFIVKRVFSYSIKKYFFAVLLPVCSVSILSAVFPILLHFVSSPGFLKLIVVYITSLLSTFSCVFFLGIDVSERHILNKKLLSGFPKLRFWKNAP
jgi:O-antigen/teichoic acid export membrane protein